MSGRFDVIVIGGGSAGCVLANRLSADPARRVLLLEEGPDPKPIPDVIADPKRQGQLILESPYVRMYDIERADGSSFPMLSGRVMGGGSSVNNCSVIRPLRRDCDAWAAFGGPAWSYDALLPLMRDLETDPDFPDSPIHGSRGPLPAHRSWKLDDPSDPPVRALIEACVDAGMPRCEDLNVPEPWGVCASPYNVRDGRRVSTAVAFLDPARSRPNLTVRPDAHVRRLVLDGTRIVGIDVAPADAPADAPLERIEGARVVLAAGVFHSPQLLLWSGIGPEAALAPHGIEVRHRLDGVGANYQDHAVVYLTFQGTTAFAEDYVVPKVRLIAKSDPALPYGDLHVFMRPTIRVPGLPPLLPVSIHLLDHRARGRLGLASADPTELPVVEPALLEHPGDIEAMTSAMRLVVDLTSHPALGAYYGSLVQPEPGVDWVEHVRTTHTCYYHGVGTCRLGPADDPMAVVGPDLRVRGLDNLWIADASVLPVLPHANTNVSAILAGELGARFAAG